MGGGTIGGEVHVLAEDFITTLSANSAGTSGLQSWSGDGKVKDENEKVPALKRNFEIKHVSSPPLASNLTSSRHTHVCLISVKFSDSFHYRLVSRHSLQHH